MLVLNCFRYFRHKYRHSKVHNNEFIRLVIHMSRQFCHEYVQSKVGTSMFRFIHNFSYVSTIHFFSVSHIFIIIYCYGFYFDLIGHIEFQFLIISNFNFLLLQIEI